ncbi:berberine bridge enzyme-like Cyn d 4 [Phragmites australis]|uniref:berberine bridge enzyme-like Cyn d 4 n=1 Tax=Phragmites australis TaxID=29695 RepID=UPI002D788E13|nr:berberine bridge enzyme-like Cyn d 4 [Phragmites australis]
MAVFRILALLLISSCYVSTPSSATSDGFLQCLWEKIPGELIYTQGASNFTDVLVSSIRNPKFFTNTTVRPLCIVTPTDASHVQAAVRCGRVNGVRLRVRSGGHDYEGLSYRSERPEVFAVVDLANLRAVTVSADEWVPTAWVDSGATLGELYYTIAKNNSGIAFPAGICPTIGVGGHFSGGGIGMMMRRFGLSIDNVLDAKLVNANGDLVDRAAMGEDLFWAIRGGGGESFGIVVSWKVSLVKVPSTVTAFNIAKTLDQGAIDVLIKWQDVGPTLPSDITIRVIIQGQRAVFQSLYLGTCGDLVPTLSTLFPELGMTSADCLEMTWLQSAVFFNTWNPNAPVESLLIRNTSLSTFTKNKSDYVRRSIPKGAWKNIFPWLTMNGAGMMILEPHGGFIGTIPTEATPYPHRSGVLYNVQYIAFWSGNDGDSVATSWISNFYSFMGQYVSSSRREAYVNYRDLDIGENVVVNDVSTFDSGRVWGEKYFAGNYQRLAAVKGAVDPTDYFRNEQSIPPLLQSN